MLIVFFASNFEGNNTSSTCNALVPLLREMCRVQNKICLKLFHKSQSVHKNFCTENNTPWPIGELFARHFNLHLTIRGENYTTMLKWREVGPSLYVSSLKCEASLLTGICSFSLSGVYAIFSSEIFFPLEFFSSTPSPIHCPCGPIFSSFLA